MKFVLFCERCGDYETIHFVERDDEMRYACDTCGALIDESLPENQKEFRAWAEDETDMARIKREWDAYDRDPPGS